MVKFETVREISEEKDEVKVILDVSVGPMGSQSASIRMTHDPENIKRAVFLEIDRLIAELELAKSSWES